jgi:hypothetical protein
MSRLPPTEEITREEIDANEKGSDRVANTRFPTDGRTVIYRHESSVQVWSDFATDAVGQGIAPETCTGGAVCVSRLMLALSDSINKLVIHAVPFLLNILPI